MQIKALKFIACYLLIAAGYLSHASDNLYNNHNESSKNFVFQKESVHNNPFNPYNFELLLNNAAPKILNAPQHRTIQFSQWFSNRPSAHTISVEFLNSICGRGNSKLSHFRRLILFPFHVFW